MQIIAEPRSDALKLRHFALLHACLFLLFLLFSLFPL